MERPAGVTVLAILSFVGAGLSALGALAFFVVGGAAFARMSGAPIGISEMVTGLGAVLGVVILACAVLYVVVGVGLWKLQNWGRILALVLLCIGLIFGLLELLGALAHFHLAVFIRELILCVIYAWIITYLLKPRVKQAFGA